MGRAAAERGSGRRGKAASFSSRRRPDERPAALRHALCCGVRWKSPGSRLGSYGAAECAAEQPTCGSALFKTRGAVSRGCESGVRCIGLNAADVGRGKEMPALPESRAVAAGAAGQRTAVPLLTQLLLSDAAVPCGSSVSRLSALVAVSGLGSPGQKQRTRRLLSIARGVVSVCRPFDSGGVTLRYSASCPWDRRCLPSRAVTYPVLPSPPPQLLLF